MFYFFILILTIYLVQIPGIFAEIAGIPCPPQLNGTELRLTEKSLIKLLTHPCRYDKIEKPLRSFPVYVQIDLNHLESNRQQQFTAFLTVQYRYQDQRLAYSHLDVNRSQITGDVYLRDRIWIPQVVISNGNDAKELGIGKSDVFVTINPDGVVVLTQRISSSFYCWMDFKKFPFDLQTCSLTWRSFTSNTSRLLLYWDDDEPVHISGSVHLTEFVLDSTRTFEREVHAPFADGPLVGNFTELVFQFHLHREIGYYMLCYFIPSILLVITSWVTFWLQADAGPPRACLGAATVVAFITLNGGLVKDLPKISYVKACDVWFLVISIFIFGALAEFAFVNVIWRRKKKVELVKADSMNILTGAFVPSKARELARKSAAFNDNPAGGDKFRVVELNGVANGDKCYDEELATSDMSLPSWETMTPQEVAIWVDRKARFVFPVAFLVFNLMYWSFVYVV